MFGSRKLKAVWSAAFLITLFGTLLSVDFTAAPASAQGSGLYRRYVCPGTSVYVRRPADNVIIGTLYGQGQWGSTYVAAPGQSFEVYSGNSAGQWYGFAYGWVNAWGVTWPQFYQGTGNC